MRKYLYIFVAIWLLAGCGGGGGEKKDSSDRYPLHRSITSTIFWIGEAGSEENGNISNLSSVWDDLWVSSYGGIDDPKNRHGYFPADFTPYENPFYVALPFNDFDERGVKKDGLESFIPWATSGDDPKESICKNRWVKIIKGGKVAYAQWEDAGPFGEDDRDYVFGDAMPKNVINNGAGIDLSPAVRDYLELEGIDEVDWRFVDEEDVPDGPWKEKVMRSGVNWIDPALHLPAGISWQWQLQGTLNLSYDAAVYDIDLFDTDLSVIEQLHEQGRKVICYFSAGSWEDWRPDAGKFPEEVKGDELDGWPGERWLDIRDERVWRLMTERLDLAEEKGCDGVEPDNMDAYDNATGFPIRNVDQIDYNRFLSREAHKRGLAVALKNDLGQIHALEPFFDFALNEQCHEFDECDALMPFIDAGKAVLNAEYDERYVENSEGARERLCADARDRNFSTLVLPVELDDSFRYICE